MKKHKVVEFLTLSYLPRSPLQYRNYEIFKSISFLRTLEQSQKLFNCKYTKCLNFLFLTHEKPLTVYINRNTILDISFLRIGDR